MSYCDELPVHVNQHFAKRRKLADPIRALGTCTYQDNTNTSTSNRCILDCRISASPVPAKRPAVQTQALPRKRRALLFVPGPRLAARISSFSEEAV